VFFIVFIVLLRSDSRFYTLNWIEIEIELFASDKECFTLTSAGGDSLRISA